LLELVRAFDVREAPHGLYGVLPEYVNGGRMPSLAHVLALPRAKVLREIGGNCHSRLRDTRVRIHVEGAWVSLTVLDHATTKVRRFGSAYRLDAHDGKPPLAPPWRLDSLVPKLGKGIGSWGYRRQALLVVMHAETEREIHTFAGRVAEPAFLDRYGVAMTRDLWSDRYDRGFFTGVYLWVGESA
jgi:hypothetical protein